MHVMQKISQCCVMLKLLLCCALRTLLLSGDFFLGGVIGGALTKLVLKARVEHSMDGIILNKCAPVALAPQP